MLVSRVVPCEIVSTNVTTSGIPNYDVGNESISDKVNYTSTDGEVHLNYTNVYGAIYTDGEPVLGEDEQIIYSIKNTTNYETVIKYDNLGWRSINKTDFIKGDRFLFDYTSSSTRVKKVYEVKEDFYRFPNSDNTYEANIYEVRSINSEAKENYMYQCSYTDISDGKLYTYNTGTVLYTHQLKYDGDHIKIYQSRKYESDEQIIVDGVIKIVRISDTFKTKKNSYEMFVLDNKIIQRLNHDGMPKLGEYKGEFSHRYLKDVTHKLEFFSSIPTIAPFDNKSRSIAYSFDSLSYTVKCLGRHDTIAITNTIGNNISFTFDNGESISRDISKSEVVLDGSDAIRNSYRGITEIVYSKEERMKNSLMTITIIGDYCQIGGIVFGKTMKDNSYTELEYTIGFDDFSPTEQDQWGNVYRTEGTKVLKLEGQCHVPLAKMTDNARALIDISGQVAIFNGADVKNEIQTEDNPYGMLRMVGRLYGFKQKSVVNKNEIKYGVYPFRIEEIV